VVEAADWLPELCAYRKRIGTRNGERRGARKSKTTTS
jgi:hypothetical protein